MAININFKYGLKENIRSRRNIFFALPDDGNVNQYQTKLLNIYLHKKMLIEAY